MPKKKTSKKEAQQPHEEMRIGVFVCHCGKNIGGVVDSKAVSDYAATLPDVIFSTDSLYTCADNGQQEMQDAIVKHKINRVVVAACSPKMHEPTFRRTVSEVGINPYLFEMANIREHCSWVHIGQNEEATEKAKDITAMAVAKVRLTWPLQNLKVQVTQEAVVIGGGVAGCQAALDLADSGYQVHMIEREPSIGGRMAHLDKTFPTMDCSICILGPKLVDVGKHPNIHLHTNTEITQVDGYIGNFKVKATVHPKYVIEEKCTGCGECEAVCPVTIPAKTEEDLSPLKAIHCPYPQAVPKRYLIDKDACINCYSCANVCGERNAIDFNQKEQQLELDIGTIIVATGAKAMDATKKPEYLYGKCENVLSMMEFERLVCAGGPTEGDLVRRDGKHARRYGFIQCVGSRDKTIHEYCSNYCCMNSIKNALLIKEHVPDAEVYIFYIDIRAFGKGFEELYNRARDQGIMFIKGRPSHIEVGDSNNPIIISESVVSGDLLRTEVDLAVLATALEPDDSAKRMAEILHIPRNNDGFFLESHPKLKPLDSPGDGIYLCGSCEAPKDIKDSVSSASGAASRANIVMAKGEVEIEGITCLVDEEKCTGCGACVRACPYGANTLVNKKAVHNPAQCHGCGTCVGECNFDAITQKHFTDQQLMAQIDAALADNPHDKILCFACNWCSYAGADLAGVSRFQYPPEIRIVRDMCSGRVSEKLVMYAFERGAQIVWVTGCHLPSDCHYISGNVFADKRIRRLQKKLPDKYGIPSERLKLNWISAAEGSVWAEYVTNLVSELKEITAKGEIINYKGNK